MKRIIISALVLSLSFASCKNNSKENNEAETDALEKSIDSTLGSLDTTGIIMPETEVATESGTEDWDATIDEYEKYIDDYISAMKKVKAGDTSAASDIAAMQEQAESLGKKLENTKDLTPAQMKRFIKMQTKLSNAIVDMM